MMSFRGLTLSEINYTIQLPNTVSDGGDFIIEKTKPATEEHQYRIKLPYSSDWNVYAIKTGNENRGLWGLFVAISEKLARADIFLLSSIFSNRKNEFQIIYNTVSGLDNDSSDNTEAWSAAMAAKVSEKKIWLKGYLLHSKSSSTTAWVASHGEVGSISNPGSTLEPTSGFRPIGTLGSNLNKMNIRNSLTQSLMAGNFGLTLQSSIIEQNKEWSIKLAESFSAQENQKIIEAIKSGASHEELQRVIKEISSNINHALAVYLLSHNGFPNRIETTIAASFPGLSNDLSYIGTYKLDELLKSKVAVAAWKVQLNKTALTPEGYIADKDITSIYTIDNSWGYLHAEHFNVWTMLFLRGLVELGKEPNDFVSAAIMDEMMSPHSLISMFNRLLRIAAPQPLPLMPNFSNAPVISGPPKP